MHSTDSCLPFVVLFASLFVILFVAYLPHPPTYYTMLASLLPSTQACLLSISVCLHYTILAMLFLSTQAHTLSTYFSYAMPPSLLPFAHTISCSLHFFQAYLSIPCLASELWANPDALMALNQFVQSCQTA